MSWIHASVETTQTKDINWSLKQAEPLLRYLYPYLDYRIVLTNNNMNIKHSSKAMGI